MSVYLTNVYYKEGYIKCSVNSDSGKITCYVGCTLTNDYGGSGCDLYTKGSYQDISRQKHSGSTPRNIAFDVSSYDDSYKYAIVKLWNWEGKECLDGEVVEIKIEEPEYRNLTIYLKDTDGNTVYGGYIDISYNYSTYTLYNIAGLTFTNIPLNTWVSFDKVRELPNYTCSSGCGWSIKLDENKTHKVTLKKKPEPDEEITISFRVYDDDSSSSKGVKSTVIVDNIHYLTRDNGTIEVIIKANSTHTIKVTADGYKDYGPTSITYGSVNQTEDIPLEKNITQINYTIYIKDASNYPISGATVRVQTYEVKTNSKGEALFSLNTNKTYTVYVSADWYRSTHTDIETSSSDGNNTIKLRKVIDDPPEYPKTVSAGGYSFISYDKEDWDLYNDFLGVVPADALDLDDYLKTKTDIELTVWKAYWLKEANKISDVPQKEKFTQLVNERYNYYLSDVYVDKPTNNLSKLLIPSVILGGVLGGAYLFSKKKGKSLKR